MNNKLWWSFWIFIILGNVVTLIIAWPRSQPQAIKIQASCAEAVVDSKGRAYKQATVPITYIQTDKGMVHYVCSYQVVEDS